MASDHIGGVLHAKSIEKCVGNVDFHITAHLSAERRGGNADYNKGVTYMLAMKCCNQSRRHAACAGRRGRYNDS